MSTNQPEGSGPRNAQEQRDQNNDRAADREREQRYPEAIGLITAELAELVDLRGRVAVAKAILGRGGDRQAAIDALDGRQQ